MAERLRVMRIRRDNISAELQRVQQAEKTKSNAELRLRIRALQHRLRNSQRQLDKLNEQRREEFSDDVSPTPPPAETCNPVGRLLDFLRPVLSQWLGPSTWSVVESFLRQILESLKCLFQ